MVAKKAFWQNKPNLSAIRRDGLTRRSPARLRDIRWRPGIRRPGLAPTHAYMGRGADYGSTGRGVVRGMPRRGWNSLALFSMLMVFSTS
jgi:hypothetical protein